VVFVVCLLGVVGVLVGFLWGVCVLLGGRKGLGGVGTSAPSRTDKQLFFVAQVFLFHFLSPLVCPYQQSPISKKPNILPCELKFSQKALYFINRAQYSIKRAIYSIKRAPYSTKRGLHSTMRAQPLGRSCIFARRKGVAEVVLKKLFCRSCSAEVVVAGSQEAGSCSQKKKSLLHLVGVAVSQEAI